MYTHKLKGLAAIALLAGGCSYDPGAGGGPESEGSLQIVVAPWEVDSEANFACYKIAVTNSAGASVWSADSVCTDKFSLGQNGTLSYVGICDASGSGRNTAKISLVRLVADDGTDLSNWGAKPPTFVGDFTCLANADTVVRASFLVISQGEKGFLDVQVSVQEIDCNANSEPVPDEIKVGSPCRTQICGSPLLSDG